MKRSLAAIIVCCLICIPFSVSAQESCSEEDKTALETCISDATAACEAQYPDCESDAIDVEDALDLLEERCGECADKRNFGKYNSCLKRVRNSIRTLKALNDEIKDAFSSARQSCKDEKRAERDQKREDKKNNKPGDDD